MEKRKEVRESDGISMKKAVIAVPRASACLFIAWQLFFLSQMDFRPSTHVKNVPMDRKTNPVSSMSLSFM